MKGDDKVKMIFLYLAWGLTGVAIAAVLVAVGTFFFDGSTTTTKWILDIAGQMIILAMALAGIAWVFAYPR